MNKIFLPHIIDTAFYLDNLILISNDQQLLKGGIHE